MERVRMLREQAQLLRDMARAPDQHPEILERLRHLARQCEDMADALERASCVE
jgi:hypothetical protein